MAATVWGRAPVDPGTDIRRLSALRQSDSAGMSPIDEVAVVTSFNEAINAKTSNSSMS